MTPQITQETWAYVDKVFSKSPEMMWNIPTLRNALMDSQEIAVQRRLQKMLIRQLHRKFTSIPESVVQKIEATRDIEQLDTWLEQVFAANSLADTGLLNSEPKQ